MENILDLQITLKCNAHCHNCIKFCNMENITGLDYSKSDMTMKQIDWFIKQVEEKDITKLFDTICVTGGEPLLHPNLIEIIEKLEDLQKKKDFKILINSNLLKPIPEKIQKYIINWSLPKDNTNIHNVVLLHPDDFGGEKKTYKTCTHYRKNRIVVNYLGYSICCAADAYIRLFDYKCLILSYLPNSLDEFPNMDLICRHCPFGNYDILPLEKDMGCPISQIYRDKADERRRAPLTEEDWEWLIVPPVKKII